MFIRLTTGVVIYERKMFIRLTTGGQPYNDNSLFILFRQDLQERASTPFHVDNQCDQMVKQKVSQFP